MEVNYISVLVATVVQFIIGALWYSVLFGKLWGRIHGFDKLSKEVQQEMMKKMGPFYGLQALVTLITSFVLAIFITNFQTWNPFAMTFFIWLGFIVPAQVSAVIFGGTEGKWILKKILVQSGAALCCLEAGAAVIYFML